MKTKPSSSRALTRTLFISLAIALTALSIALFLLMQWHALDLPIYQSDLSYPGRSGLSPLLGGAAICAILGLLALLDGCLNFLSAKRERDD